MTQREFFERETAILDGGFGTTLEDVFHKDISVPLWSASLIDLEPQTIVETHLAFLRAGSDIILTSTYQCSFSTFEQSGYSRQDAIRLMRKAVNLANDARRLFAAESPERRVKIALPLGPFGATLSPAQEFDGCYPPPYGPRAYSAAEPSTNVNSFASEADEEHAVDALTEFHLERLRAFCEPEADDVWKGIDYIAFETVPLTREVRAIRRAMGVLQNEATPKLWWISTVWPSGLYPEKRLNGAHKNVADVMRVLLEPRESEAEPHAVGFNCTSGEYLADILREATAAMAALLGRQPGREKPWLVLYPNGGDTYDIASKTWAPSASGKGEAWARQLVEIVRSCRQVWPGVVLGGCCKTGPEEIAALRRDLYLGFSVE